MIRTGPSRKGVTLWTIRSTPGIGRRYIEIQEHANVLVVEDSLDRIKRFKRWLPEARIAASATNAIDMIRKTTPDIIFVGRALSGSSRALSYGATVAKYLTRIKFQGLVICHNANSRDAEFVKRAFPATQLIPFDLLGIIRISGT